LPLRGGKFTFWDGGTKGVGFIHSPLLPTTSKGAVWPGLMHACDWYATLATAASIPLTRNSTLAADSVDMWGALAGSSRADAGAGGVAGVQSSSHGQVNAAATPNNDNDVARAGVAAGAPVYPRTVLVHHVELKHKKPIGKIRVGGWNFYIGDPGAASGWSVVLLMCVLQSVCPPWGVGCGAYAVCSFPCAYCLYRAERAKSTPLRSETNANSSNPLQPSWLFNILTCIHLLLLASICISVCISVFICVRLCARVRMLN
jgi:hypothetical protein